MHLPNILKYSILTREEGYLMEWLRIRAIAMIKFDIRKID